VIDLHIQELPEDLKKKIRKSKLDIEQVDKQFDVLCNVLRFTTKRHIVRDVDTTTKTSEKSEPKHDASESNLPSWMLKDAGFSKIQSRHSHTFLQKVSYLTQILKSFTKKLNSEAKGKFNHQRLNLIIKSAASVESTMQKLTMAK
jgi:hypothetical protein